MVEKDKLTYIIENLRKGISFARTATNFDDKENREISKETLGMMLTFLDKLNEVIENSVVVNKDLFRYFWRFLQQEIRDNQGRIDHCNKEQFMPFEQQKLFKQDSETYQKRLLLLANICEVDIDERKIWDETDLPDVLICSLCRFETPDFNTMKEHFQEHIKEVKKLNKD